MLDTETKRRIDTARDILVGKVPDPKSQVEQITLALIYKFMDDMDLQSVEWGGVRSFFTGDYERYAWSRLFDPALGGFDMLNLYSEGLTRMGENPNLPLLFRSIFKNAFLPFRDAETLRLFLKTIAEFHYDHSERLGDAYEYLLSVLGSQGDAGQFRTPRHIIDFIVQVVNPQKNETILDPACGTAGFLISAYKHILSQNSSPSAGGGRGEAEAGNLLDTDERSRLVQNFTGYDIDPGMIRNAQVNLYLHQFPDPKIFEYDTLSDEDRWNDTFDIILANPPFMTPKGFKATNKRYRIQANRSEVLFVDYIAEHIHPVSGRAAIIVPEGIIFQSSGVYQALRRMLVQEGYLWAVASLPAGVFQPYSGVKTSILFLDRRVAQKTDRVYFVKIQSDGYDLGAQRRANDKSDLPAALAHLTRTREAILASPQQEQTTPETPGLDCLSVEKTAFGEDYNLSMDRYRASEAGTTKWEIVKIGEFAETTSGGTPLKGKEEYWLNGTIPWIKSGEVAQGYVFEAEEKITELALKNSSAKILPANTVLVAMYGATAGQVGLLKFEASTNQAVCGILPNEKYLPEYLYYVLKSKKEELVLLSSGGAQPNISQGIIRNFLIPLPPLAHQRALVAQIEQWQKVADGARQVVQHYKPHIEVAEDWERVRLGEVAEFKSGGTPSKSNPEFWNGSIPWISSKDMKSDEIFDSQDKISQLAIEASATKLLPVDSILCVVRSGILQHSFPVALTKSEVAFNQDITGIVCNSQKCLPQFIFYFLKISEKSILETGVKSGVTVQSLQSGFLKNLEIPLPPLPIQQTLVAALERERVLVSAARELVAVMEEKIKNLIGGLWEQAG